MVLALLAILFATPVDWTSDQQQRVVAQALGVGAGAVREVEMFQTPKGALVTAIVKGEDGLAAAIAAAVPCKEHEGWCVARVGSWPKAKHVRVLKIVDLAPRRPAALVQISGDHQDRLVVLALDGDAPRSLLVLTTRDRDGRSTTNVESYRFTRDGARIGLVVVEVRDRDDNKCMPLRTEVRYELLEGGGFELKEEKKLDGCG
jgi:hypothetical protein